MKKPMPVQERDWTVLADIIRRMQGKEPVSPKEYSLWHTATEQIVKSAVRNKMYSRGNQENEVCSDIIVKIYLKLPQFDGKRDYKNWVWTVAVYHIIDVHRRQARHQILPLEIIHKDENGSDVVEQLEIPDENNVAEKMLYVKDMFFAIRSSLGRLDPISKGIIIDHEFNGLTIRELAEKYRLQESTVYVRLFRGKRRLKEILRNHYSPDSLYR